VDHELGEVERPVAVAAAAAAAAAAASVPLPRLVVLLVVVEAPHLLVRVAVVLPLQQQRLDEEHGRHGDERCGEQRALHRRLPRVHRVVHHARLEHHVDERRDERRRLAALAAAAVPEWAAARSGALVEAHALVPVDGPLGEDHDDEVAEEGAGEHELRHELPQEVQTLLEVQRVPPFQQQPQQHLRHAERDGHLHLERVVEEQLVGLHGNK